MKNRKIQGVTALELMVTMAVVAILLTTGVPAFKNYGWNLRMKISHNIQTIICPANDSNTCSGNSDWQGGWIVFTDLNGDRNRQEGEPLRKHAGAVEFLDINSSRSRSFLRFYPNGSAPGSNISIRFCDQRGAQFAGKIVVSNSGRIRMETGGIEATENCP
jgi:type IV fimbrial biogenesis protein FimT